VSNAEFFLLAIYQSINKKSAPNFTIDSPSRNDPDSSRAEQQT
jgi:hypothetical protein